MRLIRLKHRVIPVSEGLLTLSFMFIYKLSTFVGLRMFVSFEEN